MSAKTYSAPSNIAIIKYMGKTNSQQNLPTNPSISYTLNHLKSFVMIEPIQSDADQWEPLKGPGLLPIELSEKGKTKFLNHLARIKDLWQVKQNFIVRSANNFPSDCGIASSSSSFAALTLAAVSECQKLNPKAESEVSPIAMSKISRLGSGSSCRSFFGPWAIWENDGAMEWPCPFENLDHSVMLIDSSKKEVSSSEAHLRVTTSPLFAKRLDNVKERLQGLNIATENVAWDLFAELAIEEFEEMHQLFETSVPSFSYRNQKTMSILKQLNDFNKNLPYQMIITMDAGNNIHLMTQDHLREDLENVQRLFPEIRFINSWNFEGSTVGGL